MARPLAYSRGRPRTFADLLERFGSIAPVFELPRAELERLGLRPATIEALGAPPWDDADADLRWLEGGNRHLLTWADSAYPATLRDARGHHLSCSPWAIQPGCNSRSWPSSAAATHRPAAFRQRSNSLSTWPPPGW